MKSHYSILPLVLLGIAANSTDINADSTTTANSVVSAVGQRLDDPIPAPLQKGPIRLRLKQITDGLTAPNWAVSAPGDSEHLYTVDQNGKLWRIDLASGDKLFMSFSSLLVPLGIAGSDSYDERGFLGFAFHPQRPLHGNTPRIRDWMIVLCFKTTTLKC